MKSVNKRLPLALLVFAVLALTPIARAQYEEPFYEEEDPVRIYYDGSHIGTSPGPLVWTGPASAATFSLTVTAYWHNPGTKTEVWGYIADESGYGIGDADFHLLNPSRLTQDVELTVPVAGLSAGTYGVEVRPHVEGYLPTAGGTVSGNPGYFQFTIEEEEPTDATPPVITPIITGTPGNNGWYISDVIVDWEVVDDESEITSIEYDPDLPHTVTTDTVGTTFTCTATSAGGTSTESVTIKRDATAPEIEIVLPEDGAVYLLNQVVPAGWVTTDATSGVASEEGKPDLGEAIDTATVGTKTFTVTAEDNAGNTASVTVTYYVQYDFGGFLPPVNPDGSSVFKLKSTIPVKFQLFDANGDPVSTATARIYVQKIGNGDPGEVTEAVSTAAATTGNLFRYDSADEQYIFNLATKPLSTGSWLIIVRLDDGTEYTVGIGLR